MSSQGLEVHRHTDRQPVGLPDGARQAQAPRIEEGRILDLIFSGIAILKSDLSIVWHNRPFAELCESPPAMGMNIYQALACQEIEGPDFCPFNSCMSGKRRSRSRLRLKSERHVEVTVQSITDTPGPIQLLCLARDVTSEVRQREKLMAIHRAGLELTHLTHAELSQMTTSERVDLLKANIVQYSQKILNFKNLEVRVLDLETKELKPLLSEGMTNFNQQRRLFARPEDNGVTGFVASTGTSYLCGDVEHDPLYLPGAEDAKSSLTVPIIYRDAVIGTFNVESNKPDGFSESDREFLEVFAREIAVALNTLELLQAEKQFGGAATVEAIVQEVGIPVDDILSDTYQVQEYLCSPDQNQENAREAVRRMLSNARSIKTAIQKVRRQLDQATQAEAPSDPSTSRIPARRVLLVDAEPEIRRSAHSLLGRIGCDVDTARFGGEAVRLVTMIDYDVVIGDIRLPDMNGYEFFSAIRKQRPNLPIVLMTGFGYDAAHSLVRARQDGLRAILYKPFRLDRLREAIEEAIDPGRMAQSKAGQCAVPVKQSIL